MKDRNAHLLYRNAAKKSKFEEIVSLYIWLLLKCPYIMTFP